MDVCARAVPPLHEHILAHLRRATAVIHGEPVHAEIQIKCRWCQEHGPAARSDVRELCYLLLYQVALIRWFSAVATFSPSLLMACVGGDVCHHDTLLPVFAIPGPAVWIFFALVVLHHGLYAAPTSGAFIRLATLTRAFEDLFAHPQPAPVRNRDCSHALPRSTGMHARAGALMHGEDGYRHLRVCQRSVGGLARTRACRIRAPANCLGLSLQGLKLCA